MQNSLSLLAGHRLHFSASGFLPAAMFSHLPRPFQTPRPGEPPPASLSLSLSFPLLSPPWLPPCRARRSHHLSAAGLPAAGGRTPGVVRSCWTAAGAPALPACPQLPGAGLHGEGVFPHHLHARCALSHPSSQRASPFSLLHLTPSHRLFSHTFLVSLDMELRHGNVPWMCHPLFPPCRSVFLEPPGHLPLAAYIEKTLWCTDSVVISEHSPVFASLNIP